MKLINFIMRHKNWEELLSQSPYFIKMKWNGDYCMFKYDMLNSDFNSEIVRECRGSILYFENGMPAPVCVPFYKFGNYGEYYVNDIDWTSAQVMEKIDGSLMKVWYHNGWRLSTNNSFDAFDTYLDEAKLSFGELFERAVGMPFKEFCVQLNRGWTYMFELTTPENKVVVEYEEDGVWFLGLRNNFTLNETGVVPQLVGVKYPKIFKLKSLDDCIAAAAALGDNAEGFVVRDFHFNRIKVKNPAWLAASHMKGNGTLSNKKIIRMIREGIVDDYLAYFPDKREKVVEIVEKINKFAVVLNNFYDEVIESGVPRKFIAEEFKSVPYLGYVFYAIDGKGTAHDYIDRMFIKKLLINLDSIEKE